MFDKVSSHMVHRCTNLRDMGVWRLQGFVCMVFAWCLWRVKTNMAWQTGLAKPTKKAALPLLRNL